MEPTRRPGQFPRAASDDPTLDAIDSLTAIVESEIEARRVHRPASGGGFYVHPWLAGVVAALLAASIMWLTATVVSLREDVAVIKSNRFTNGMANDLRRDIERQIPPPEVLRRLMDHERRLERIENGGDG